MKVANEEVVSLLGILSCCMAQHAQEQSKSEDNSELERFKRHLNTLSEKEQDAVLDELQRYVWLHDVV